MHSPIYMEYSGNHKEGLDTKPSSDNILADLDGVLALEVQTGQVDCVLSLTVGGIGIDPVPSVLEQPQDCILTVVGGGHQERSEGCVPGPHIKVNCSHTQQN